MEFINNILAFLFDGGDISKMEHYNGIFAVSSGLMGLVCISVDFLHYQITRKKSFLNLSYITWRGNLKLFVIWSLCSALMGFAGRMFDIFQLKLIACAITGISWPLILAKLAKQYEKDEPSQNQTTEEEV